MILNSTVTYKSICSKTLSVAAKHVIRNTFTRFYSNTTRDQ